MISPALVASPRASRMLLPISELMVWARDSIRSSAIDAAFSSIAVRWWAGVLRQRAAPATALSSAASVSEALAVTISARASPE